jgi:hypothetical protein
VERAVGPGGVVGEPAGEHRAEPSALTRREAGEIVGVGLVERVQAGAGLRSWPQELPTQVGLLYRASVVAPHSIVTMTAITAVIVPMTAGS